jgi:hypothetical protein
VNPPPLPPSPPRVESLLPTENPEKQTLAPKEVNATKKNTNKNPPSRVDKLSSAMKPPPPPKTKKVKKEEKKTPTTKAKPLKPKKKTKTTTNGKTEKKKFSSALGCGRCRYSKNGCDRCRNRKKRK